MSRNYTTMKALINGISQAVAAGPVAVQELATDIHAGDTAPDWVMAGAPEAVLVAAQEWAGGWACWYVHQFPADAFPAR